MSLLEPDLKDDGLQPIKHLLKDLFLILAIKPNNDTKSDKITQNNTTLSNYEDHTYDQPAADFIPLKSSTMFIRSILSESIKEKSLNHSWINQIPLMKP